MTGGRRGEICSLKPIKRPEFYLFCFKGRRQRGPQGLLQDGSWSLGGEKKCKKKKKRKKEGGPRLSSGRPWWDLCRGARYTAFRRGGGCVFMLVRGWELLIFSKTEFSPPDWNNGSYLKGEELISGFNTVSLLEPIIGGALPLSSCISPWGD